MILLSCTELIVKVRVGPTCLFLFVSKQADDIAKRCQRYIMNKITCFSSNSIHFS